MLGSILHSRGQQGKHRAVDGGVAVAKIRTKWPNNEDVQTWVRKLANLIGVEMKAWADEE
jgi:hypothetical protein